MKVLLFVVLIVTSVTSVTSDKCEANKQSYLLMREELIEENCDYVTPEVTTLVTPLECQCEHDAEAANWLSYYYTLPVGGLSVPE